MLVIILEAEFYKMGLRGSGMGFIKELAIKSTDSLNFHVVYGPPPGIIYPEWRNKSYEYKRIHGIPWSSGKRPFVYFVTDIIKIVRLFSKGADNIRLVTKGREKAEFFSGILGKYVEDLEDKVPPVNEIRCDCSCDSHDFDTRNCASAKASTYLSYIH